jgi:hypothetical protein
VADQQFLVLGAGGLVVLVLPCLVLVHRHRTAS